ncbi:insulinase family protein [PVC group bacterium]|nr:insulinase family protein [PVC group bacterium]
MMITQLMLIASLFGVPSHPDDIQYQEYNFTPPLASEYRHELSSGVPVYIVEDKELPLINLSLTFRGGSYLDPSNMIGVSSMMSSLLRSGGTTSMSAEELDEQFEFLAASARVNSSGETVNASLNSLSSNFDESLHLFFDMLKNPGFQQSRIDLSKDGVIERLKQRNDYPASVLRRETASILYGDSYKGRSTTQEMVAAVTAEDLRTIYKKIVNPSNLIIAVSGDFNKGEMLQTLDYIMADWPFGETVKSPLDIDSNYDPGIYFVDQDVPQGGVRIVLRSLRQEDPDLEAATVMNYILGGGGFGSRITQTVRSDEGLAYSAGSFLMPGIYMDGLWGSGYESKSKTVMLAASLVFDEIRTIKEELVSEDDLDFARGALIEQFPSVFQSKAQTIGVFVSDEISGRDPQYWSEYKNRISAVTADDVMRVANELLTPADMAMVVVGDWGVISRGNDRASSKDILEIIGGSITELPLRDPLTLEPIN